MESEAQLERARNEVFRKFGRNVLNFQRVEHMLKFLIANGQIAGNMSDVMAKREQRAAAIQNLTMGNLVGAFIENTLTVHEEVATDQDLVPEELKEPNVSCRFFIETDVAGYQRRKQALASIVAERNDLIHHSLRRFDLKSLAGCMDADQYLEQQRERLLPEFDTLSWAIDTMQDAKKAFAEFFNSDDSKKQFELLWLRQSRLVLLLADVPTKAARPDGWTSLSRADQIVRALAPEEMAALNEKYGHRTLKGLILATELFDILEEPTDRGGVRVLYRLKPSSPLFLCASA